MDEATTRFCLLHEPGPGAARRGSVLFVHPFAEEMNNSRRIAALQARAYAEAGFTVLQIDLFGCGDSDGDFGQATWKRWLDDVSAAAAWLQEKTKCAPVLWGLRAGCLLCVQAVSRLGGVAQLVLWQPVVSGRQHVQQFLRLRVAQHLMGGRDAGRGGVQALREQLARGESVEVGGYALSPALALPLDAAELQIDGRCPPIAWLEVNAGASGQVLSPVSRARIEKLRAGGGVVEGRAVSGPAFWQNPGASECPALIAATLALTLPASCAA